MYSADVQEIVYTYDNLSRLIEADYGATQYSYGYDVAGNMTNMNGATRTFNAANQMTNDGTNNLTYDENGNLTSDGVNSYQWDRANRLLSMGGSSYAYDGNGARISQTIAANVTKYLLDTQPGLSVVLSETTGANSKHFIHSVRGIFAHEDNSGNWYTPLPDALGTVRLEVDDSLAVQGMRHATPYGADMSVQGSFDSPFGFTGEQVDANDLVHLRARHYNPGIGVFTALDPFEGLQSRPMSLNGYSWVEGNVVNSVDPSGNRICSDMPISRDRNSGFGRCWTQVRSLRDNYGIKLRSETTNGLDDWTSSRVANVHSAVTAIDAKLSSATRNAIGDTEVILVGSSPGSEAARASTCNRLRLFLSFTEGDGVITNHVHTVNNIVHEFGHTFTQFRNNQPFNTWQEINVWKAANTAPMSEDDDPNTGIDSTAGWDFSRRENKGATNSLVAEVVADMFLFWVRGIPFDNEEIGQIRADFANGGNVRNILQRPTQAQENADCASNPNGCPLNSEGFRAWANNAAPCSASSADAGTRQVVSLQYSLSNGVCGDTIPLLLASVI